MKSISVKYINNWSYRAHMSQHPCLQNNFGSAWERQATETPLDVCCPPCRATSHFTATVSQETIYLSIYLPIYLILLYLSSCLSIYPPIYPHNNQFKYSIGRDCARTLGSAPACSGADLGMLRVRMASGAEVFSMPMADFLELW